jgi:hypothetical protein
LTLSLERLLLHSLKLLHAANARTPDTNRLGERLLKLSAKRDALLSALPGGAPKAAADKARWELVRYVNKIAQKKTAAKI